MSANHPTIKEIALRLNVSISTVSRALHDHPRIGIKTKERVRELAREMKYEPNAQAIFFKQQKTAVIGVVLPSIREEFFSQAISGIEAAATQYDYTILFGQSHDDPAIEKRVIESMKRQRVDGIIIAPSNDASCSALQSLAKESCPIVLIDREIPNLGLDVVQSDNQHDALRITQHLIALGHRRIGFISGDNRISTSRDRLYGYRLALDTAGIPFDSSLVCEENPSLALPGYISTQKLCQRSDRPDAIMAINAMTAMGVVQVCNERQLRIPHDIALVSFDDLEYASVLFPFFTVMEQPTTSMGETAVNRLILRIQKPDQDIANIKLSSTFIERRSCGSLKNEDFFRNHFAFR